MKDHHSSLYVHMNAPTFTEQEQLKCPRCESSNTKFCYYNNYNLSQPRHFCKNCRRYWTKGGALRNIPVGGGGRKTIKRSPTTKRLSSTPSQSSSLPTAAAASSSTAAASSSSSSSVVPAGFDNGCGMLHVGNSGNLSLVLGSGNRLQFGDLMSGLSQHGSVLQLGEFGKARHGPGSGLGSISGFEKGDFSALLGSRDSMNMLSRHGSNLQLADLGNSNPNSGPGPMLGSDEIIGASSSNEGRCSNLITGLSKKGSVLQLGECGNNPGPGLGSIQTGDLQMDGYGENGWPDPAIYTRVSSFQ